MPVPLWKMRLWAPAARRRGGGRSEGMGASPVAHGRCLSSGLRQWCRWCTLLGGCPQQPLPDCWLWPGLGGGSSPGDAQQPATSCQWLFGGGWQRGLGDTVADVLQDSVGWRSAQQSRGNVDRQAWEVPQRNSLKSSPWGSGPGRQIPSCN